MRERNAFLVVCYHILVIVLLQRILDHNDNFNNTSVLMFMSINLKLQQSQLFLLQKKKVGHFFYHRSTSIKLGGEQEQQFGGGCEPTHFTPFYSRCILIYSAFRKLLFELFVALT